MLYFYWEGGGASGGIPPFNRSKHGLFLRQIETGAFLRNCA